MNTMMTDEQLDNLLAKDEKPPVWILYGTHTGNSEQLAKDTAEEFSKKGVNAHISNMEDFDTNLLSDIRRLLIIVSTDGEGEPPLMAEDLLEYLQSEKAPDLSGLSYSILALGDTTYFDFCQAGKDFDSALEKLGAKRILNRMDCDVDFEENYKEWIDTLLKMETC
ncbi:MAG: hypothetical protein EPN39_15270 [Chitinophagaceae bacterium]|nr:MAG: hypothetical protein EPN39_15270 [Chitinophagaceae bacterium]